MFVITKGMKVVNIKGEVGTIVSVGDYIEVDFEKRTATYGEDAFIKGYLRFLNVEVQKEVDTEIARIAKEKAEKAEKDRIAAEEFRALAQKLAAEKQTKKAKSGSRAKNRNKGKKSGSVHPHIDQRRKDGKHAIFMVCQNNNYDVESQGGYIWAPDHQMRGDTDLASHAEMDIVKAGDIIIHHFDNKIYAISVAKKDCEHKAATSGHPNCGEVGRYVELSYHFLANPADTSGLKVEKIAYGAMKYGPFDITGKNKRGFYLSELADKLAMAFLEVAIKANPRDIVLHDFIKEI